MNSKIIFRCLSLVRKKNFIIVLTILFQLNQNYEITYQMPRILLLISMNGKRILRTNLLIIIINLMWLCLKWIDLLRKILLTSIRNHKNGWWAQTFSTKSFQFSLVEIQRPNSTITVVLQNKSIGKLSTIIFIIIVQWNEILNWKWNFKKEASNYILWNSVTITESNPSPFIQLGNFR